MSPWNRNLVIASMLWAGTATAQTPTPIASPTASPTPPPPQDRPFGVPPGYDEQIATPTPVSTPGEPTPAPTPESGGAPRRPPSADEPLPFQFTLAGGVAFDDEARSETPRSVGFGSLWLGGAFYLEGNHRRLAQGFYIGPGFEGTVDGENGPYQWSIGAGTRFGMVWRAPGDKIPNAYVYTRVTPFMGMRTVAGPGYLAEIQEDEDPNFTQQGAGVRIGLGVVAPVWTGAVLSGIGDAGPEIASVSSPEEAVACCLFGAIVVLTNSIEITAEMYEEPDRDPILRFGIRAGVGF